MIKSLPIYILFASCILSSCAKKNFRDISEILEIELETVTDIPQNNSEFINTATNKPVTVLHSLQNTGFHFYNSVVFSNHNTGVLVGGTGLRLRVTTNGGSTWNQYSFSRFANAFHDATFINNTLFVVGESEFIFKTTDFGKTWSVFNMKQLYTSNSIAQFKAYKIKFINNKIGFCAGELNGNSILLKTTNAGEDWQVVDVNQINNNAITDLTLINNQEINIVTRLGECYKSTNQGETWQLLYSSPDLSLNAIDFKDANTGIIGGERNHLAYTEDAGKNWRTIMLPASAANSTITDIKFANNKILLTTAKSFQSEERNEFVYLLNENTTKCNPFITKTDSTVTFIGDSHSIDVHSDVVYTLDRNNLYKTDLSEIN